MLGSSSFPTCQASRRITRSTVLQPRLPLLAPLSHIIPLQILFPPWPDLSLAKADLSAVSTVSDLLVDFAAEGFWPHFRVEFSLRCYR